MSTESDRFLSTVRSAIGHWKQSELQTAIQEAQEVTTLNQYLRKSVKVYDTLKEYLESGQTQALDPSLREVIQAIGSVPELSREKEMLLHEYLFRDLIEYPFTYNRSLINSFSKSNALNTNIIPNK